MGNAHPGPFLFFFFADAPSSYVLAVATSTFFINTFHSVLTSKARSKSGVKYPIAYASQEQAEKDPAAYLFNCGTSPSPLPALYVS